MKCPNCDTVNPKEAKFCFNCANSLEGDSGSEKQTELKAVQKAAPKGLQEKMRAAGSEIEGERKPVTILFADIVGSTSLAEKLDPEEWKEIVSGAHRRLGEAIYRYEGTIAQLLGDGLLAFFGAPITHEDDPTRAVHAALDIQSSIRGYSQELEGYVDGFQMRVGINTGKVVVGDIGTDQHVEYLAIGDAVNVAARMESAAQPGKVLISAQCARHVRSVFELQDMGEIPLKGKIKAMQVFEVQGVKTEPGDKRGIEGMPSVHVGRESELESLQTALNALCAGHGQVVMVLGEAGIGKSRLLERAKELGAKEVDETKEQLVPPASLRWLEGRSLSYGASLSFWAITKLLLADLGLSDGSPEVKIKVALNKRVKKLFGKSDEDVLPYLARLLGINQDKKVEEELDALNGKEFRTNTLSAICLYFSQVADERPTLLVFEDLHWADPSSLDALGELLANTDRVPLMLLCLLREERDHGSWDIIFQAKRYFSHRYTELQLKRLSISDSGKMVEQLLGTDGLSKEIRKVVLNRSEGNPLYVEELIRHLLERDQIKKAGDGWIATEKIDKIGIPDTLQGMLLARIDRLEEEVRGTLQIASVIGRSFAYQVLEAISDAERQLDAHLTQLQRVDLVREKARIPELEYIFKHSMTQEAAYNSMLVERRQEFHQRVAGALEFLFEDQIEELNGLLAHHWMRAGDNEKALEYLTLAGDRARLAYANQEALGYYQAALELVADIEDDKLTAVRLHRKIIEIGINIYWLEDFQRIESQYDNSIQTGLELVDTLSPHAEVALLLVSISRDAWMRRVPQDWELAEDHAVKAVKIAEKMDEPEILSTALGALSFVYYGLQKYTKSLEISGQQLQLLKTLSVENKPERVDGLSQMGRTLVGMGEYRKSIDYLQEAEQLADQIQDVHRQVLVMTSQVDAWYNLDEWDHVLEMEIKLRELVERYPNFFTRSSPPCFQIGLAASVHALKGEFERAAELREESNQIMIKHEGSSDRWDLYNYI
jgi:class 3 adenylate cyclase/tetratricopeptide (TPR) repeat protein